MKRYVLVVELDDILHIVETTNLGVTACLKRIPQDTKYLKVAIDHVLNTSCDLCKAISSVGVYA